MGTNTLWLRGVPKCDFFVSLPLSIRGLPIWLRGLCFRHPFSHALKNIFFAEASQFSCAHRANIPYHHHTSIAVAVAFATAAIVSCSMAGCHIDASASHPLDSASASKRLTSAYWGPITSCPLTPHLPFPVCLLKASPPICLLFAGLLSCCLLLRVSASRLLSLCSWWIIFLVLDTTYLG